MKTTPADPDAWFRTWLRTYATAHPWHGFRRAWAALRFDEGVLVNKKKVHRLWREEGLQRPATRRKKRRGNATVIPEPARPTRPGQVWAMDVQFDTTTDGKPINIASMIDAFTRQSVLHVVARGITSDALCGALAESFQRPGKPAILRMDNGPECISKRLAAFTSSRVGMAFIPPGQPWHNGVIESFNRRLREECLNRNDFHNLLEANVIIGDWKQDHNTKHRHSSAPLQNPKRVC